MAGQLLPYPDEDMVKVRGLVARLARPFWMGNPLRWEWARPDGQRQGFAGISYDNPGMANLLWLAMDMGGPPQRYDILGNTACAILLTGARTAKLADSPLLDVAGLLPLDEFVRLLPESPAGAGAGAEALYPLLRVLALGRLRHAHP